MQVSVSKSIDLMHPHAFQMSLTHPASNDCLCVCIFSTGSPVSPSSVDDLLTYAIFGLIILGGVNTPFKGESLLNRALLLVLSKRLQASR